MSELLGGVSSDALAGGTVGGIAGNAAGSDWLTGLLMSQLGGQGGPSMLGGSPMMGGGLGGQRAMPPLGPLVGGPGPPMLGPSTFPQLGVQNIGQILARLLGMPSGLGK